MFHNIMDYGFFYTGVRVKQNKIPDIFVKQ